VIFERGALALSVLALAGAVGCADEAPAGDATPYVGRWRLWPGQMVHDCEAGSMNSVLLTGFEAIFSSSAQSRLDTIFGACPIELRVTAGRAELERARACDTTIQRTTMKGSFDRFELVPSNGRLAFWAHATAQIDVNEKHFECNDVVMDGIFEWVSAVPGKAATEGE
jgi:hypothetical protein